MIFYNNGTTASTVSIKLKDIGFSYGLGYEARDISNGVEIGHVEILLETKWNVPSGPGGVLMVYCYPSE